MTRWVRLLPVLCGEVIRGSAIGAPVECATGCAIRTRYPEVAAGRSLRISVFLQLAFGFVQTLASGFDCSAVAVSITLQLAQVGAGKGHLGLQCACLLVDRPFVGADQLWRGLGRLFFCGMQCLFGTPQSVTQLAELDLIGAGLFGFL